MNIEPDMLCEIVVPSSQMSNPYWCYSCGRMAFTSAKIHGRLCTTLCRDDCYLGMSMWTTQLDEPVFCCAGKSDISVPEEWLRPLPPPEFTLHREEELTV